MAKVLVVDDEASIREVVSRWLASAGHEPVEAEHAYAALAQMERSPAAVVLVDVQMPGPDGLWLTGELRRRFPATAIALATGVSTVPPQVSMQAGVLAYLLKPFRKEALLRAVAQGVAWHEEAKTRVPREEESIDRVMEWLNTIDGVLDGRAEGR
jgi:DNA-binding NtrC family response regulator